MQNKRCAYRQSITFLFCLLLKINRIPLGAVYLQARYYRNNLLERQSQLALW